MLGKTTNYVRKLGQDIGRVHTMLLQVNGCKYQ